MTQNAEVSDEIQPNKNMNVHCQDGKVSLDLHDLLPCITPESKYEMIESMSCDDALIKHVADQIINKWTQNAYSGGTCCTASDNPTFGLDWAWREVAKHSGEVAKREIERLEDALRVTKKQLNAVLDELYAERRQRL